MNEASKMRRPVGRPRMGKVKMIVSVAPEIKQRIDQFAKSAGLTRSAYVENLFRDQDLVQ